jgi:Domain of unknown function (DUF4965)/Domain of unknown function (DUF1793)/Domain of unknown function (DUF5127)/Domain of unknown function (DUF4964)
MSELPAQVLSWLARHLLTFTLVIAGCSAALLAEAQVRPPVVPLVTHDPYFSIWSMADHLTDVNTRHWTGVDQPLAGLIRIDNVAYRYMGADPRQVPAMQQVSLEVTPLHTIYTFETAGVRLQVTFFTAAFPNDLDALSRPVDYLTWNITSADSRPHAVDLLLDASPVIAVDTNDQDVTWGRSMVPGMQVLRVGSREQRVLNREGDNLRIDWGYFYLAVPDQAGATLATVSNAMQSFLASGSLGQTDDMDMPREPRNRAAHLAVAFHVQAIPASPVNRHVLLAYDDSYSIEYLGRKLRPYWRRDGQTAAAMLAVSEAQYPHLEETGKHFDAELTGDLTRVGGKDYAWLATLAYRQTFAAHGFAADVDGTPMLFPKENFSNGCISTVDVLYPSSPFFLFFNPALLEAQLKPVLEYSALPRWKFPFAPHDLGTYPLADGQVYGGGELTEENQMPVEESANMLIMMDALGHAQGNQHLAEQYWPQLTKWADYLLTDGLDPANQLSTDDFAGHLAHNANLSIKAIEGIDAYAQMATKLGKLDVAKKYATSAKQMAGQWVGMALDGDHYKLAFDKPGTWSQKYNLVWDMLLGMDLFPSSVRKTEMAFYLQHLNQYGLPLDNRADYTKLDWELWTATLTDDPSQFTALMDPIAKWLRETPTRVPLGDWYDTKTGVALHFQARSVVGGVFVKALADKKLTEKWNRFIP